MDASAAEQFAGITGLSLPEAASWLNMVDGNVENAVMLFFEMGGSDNASRPPMPSPGPDRRSDTGDAHEKSPLPSRPVDAGGCHVESCAAAGDEGPSRSERLRVLAEHLMSPAVQAKAPASIEAVPLRLRSKDVAKVFVDHVPGVSNFIYRENQGKKSLAYLQSAYKDGLTFFQGTPVHKHLLSLMRIIVHYAYDHGPSASKYLKEVAEAFTDCQAVQARAIERVGLHIRGVACDFAGLVIGLVGEYKTVALKMLAAEHISKGTVRDNDNPVHYENRLTADLGESLGLNEVDVRTASLDRHAQERFACLTGASKRAAERRCRELFDVDALLKAFVAEVNSFSASSPESSLPRKFLEWSTEKLTPVHIVMDQETCSRVDVGEELGLAILEVLFLSTLSGSPTEMYREHSLWGLFFGGSGPADELMQDPVQNIDLHPAEEVVKGYPQSTEVQELLPCLAAADADMSREAAEHQPDAFEGQDRPELEGEAAKRAKRAEAAERRLLASAL